jgi:hypothetical protein
MIAATAILTAAFRTTAWLLLAILNVDAVRTAHSEITAIPALTQVQKTKSIKI